MKILIFSWRDIKNPKSGGAEVFTHEIAERWVKKGHQVSLVTSRPPLAKEKETINGVKIFRPSKLFYVTPQDYIRYIKETADFYNQRFKGKVDIVIDQIHGLPIFCKFFVKEPVVALAHEVAKNIWFYEVRPPLSLIGYLIEPIALWLYRQIPFITVSPSTAKDLKKIGIKKISIVPEGISFKPARSLPKKAPYPLLVSLGRLTKMKRIEESMKAFKIIADSFPKAQFHIAGKGDWGYPEELKILAEKLGIERKTKFLGYISEPRKIQLLKKAWLIISTSAREGWGIIIIEAAANGTPAAVYKAPGLVDSVKHLKTGVICPTRSPTALANKVEELLLDKTLRSRLSKNALEYSREFDWNNTARECLLVLKKRLNQSFKKPS